MQTREVDGTASVMFVMAEFGFSCVEYCGRAKTVSVWKNVTV